jgi:ArsR family transcriptional regulator, arsenate/arsenite/antimonite-responsive transcriptional repressor
MLRSEPIDTYRHVNTDAKASGIVMKLATEEFDKISKALADPQRREILQKLVASRLNCTDVHALFNVSQPTVSHHLKELANAGLLDKEKQGQFCFYHVRAEVLSAYVGELEKRMGLVPVAMAQRARPSRV